MAGECDKSSLAASRGSSGSPLSHTPSTTANAMAKRITRQHAAAPLRLKCALFSSSVGLRLGAPYGEGDRGPGYGAGRLLISGALSDVLYGSGCGIPLI